MSPSPANFIGQYFAMPQNLMAHFEFYSRFYNRNASSIRAVMVATCLPDSEIAPEMDTTTDDAYSCMDCSNSEETVERGNPVSHRELNAPPINRHRSLKVDRGQR